jgi:hypothetical protein
MIDENEPATVKQCRAAMRRADEALEAVIARLDRLEKASAWHRLGFDFLLGVAAVTALVVAFISRG